ncbi:MAG: hypothetical protein LBC70_01755 [Chitinispirillales bacterium]|jgi:hypothetical protein|nr:hypothetical protein [Chitinispirillales bacterium]
MKALWKLCLVVGVGVVGLAGQMVMPKGTGCEIFDLVLEEDSYGLSWRPDTAGYPITLGTNLINSEGEAWRAAVGGHYEIMRSDGSFTVLDINGAFIRNGTWFMIENFQITDHPYQVKPVAVNIVYYNVQQNDGRMATFRSYYTDDRDIHFKIGVTSRRCFFRTKAPTE